MYADDVTVLIEDEMFSQTLIQSQKWFCNLLRPENKYLENGRIVAWKPKMPLGQTCWPEEYVFAPGVAFTYDSTTVVTKSTAKRGLWH